MRFYCSPPTIFLGICSGWMIMPGQRWASWLYWPRQGTITTAVSLYSTAALLYCQPCKAAVVVGPRISLGSERISFFKCLEMSLETRFLPHCHVVLDFGICFTMEQKHVCHPEKQWPGHSFVDGENGKEEMRQVFVSGNCHWPSGTERGGNTKPYEPMWLIRNSSSARATVSHLYCCGSSFFLFHIVIHKRWWKIICILWYYF